MACHLHLTPGPLLQLGMEEMQRLKDYFLQLAKT